MLKFFENYPEVLAVMSEKKDGSMKLFDKNWDLNKKTEENRRNYFEKIGINYDNVVYAYLKNTSNVKIIENNCLKIIPEMDGLVTKQKNLYLAITAADCIPVYFYDIENKIVAISHCGWRGIVGGIINNTFAKISELGGKAKNLKIALGPGINKCHFEIREDVLDKFKNYPKYIIRENEKIFIDLKGIIIEQLGELGINLEDIENNSECTFENKDKYFSFRRDKPETPEAMVAVIGISKT